MIWLQAQQKSCPAGTVRQPISLGYVFLGQTPFLPKGPFISSGAILEQVVAGFAAVQVPAVDGPVDFAGLALLDPLGG